MSGSLFAALRHLSFGLSEVRREPGGGLDADDCGLFPVDGQICEDWAGERDELPVPDDQVMHSPDASGPTWR